MKPYNYRFLLPRLLALCFISPAFAEQAGMTGYSGDPSVGGGQTCVACHSDTRVARPMLALTGPGTMEAGSEQSFTLTMSASQGLAGFNIKVDSGALINTLGNIAQLKSGELTHKAPISVAGNSVQWTFNYRAPVIPGTITLYAAAVSANGDSFPETGDSVAATTLSVVVSASSVPLKAVPVAKITGPQVGLPDAALSFNGSASTDADGQINRYLWDFGDGSAFAQGVTQTHSYAGEGVYTVTMAATDNDNITGATAITLTITYSPGVVTGQTLYNDNCLRCHGANGNGTTIAKNIVNATTSQIDTALANIPSMNALSLTAEDIQAIADFLASGAGEPPIRPTDGAGLYSFLCAGCHGDDGRGGTYKGVTGAAAAFISRAITNVAAMQNIVVSVEEKQKIATFLQQGGSGALPATDDGAGLFDVFCAVCHGKGGVGASQKRVTGASSGMIDAAIKTGQPLMQGLSGLTATQISSIGTYLGAGGDGPLPDTGPQLYEVFCAVCHGPGGSGGKHKTVTGASLTMIQNAIVSNVPEMNALSMTPTQLEQIATFLGNGGDQARPTQGVDLYHAFCSVCHGQNGVGGPQVRITGATAPYIQDALNSSVAMRHLNMSATEVSAIGSYLAAGGGGNITNDGLGLYTVFCATCHGPDGRGGKYKAITGAPVAFIDTALTNVNYMQGLVLSTQPKSTIATFLVAGGDGPRPVTATDLYTVFCSTCHGADGRGGPYKPVTGASNAFVSRALSNVNLMSGLSLSTGEISSVAGLLAAGGIGPKPTTGQGLYTTFCETCHGPNGNGGPETSVRGISANEILSAISGNGNGANNGVAEMRHLSGNVTQGDASLIAGFLGGAGGGN